VGRTVRTHRWNILEAPPFGIFSGSHPGFPEYAEVREGMFTHPSPLPGGEDVPEFSGDYGKYLPL
jgi:hypothetical protein